jgi:hypothetical protein
MEQIMNYMTIKHSALVMVVCATVVVGQSEKQDRASTLPATLGNLLAESAGDRNEALAEVSAHRAWIVAQLIKIIEEHPSPAHEYFVHDTPDNMAARLLGEYRAVEAARPLWRAAERLLLEEPDLHPLLFVQKAPIARALVSIGSPVRADLLTVLESHQDSSAWWCALMIMREIDGDDILRYRLETRLSKSPDTAVKAAVSQALAELTKLHNKAHPDERWPVPLGNPQ